MATLTKPMVRVRMTDSSPSKIVTAQMASKLDDDAAAVGDVRFPDGAYRIVMHCQSAGAAITDKKSRRSQ
jgi:hypothetical protein